MTVFGAETSRENFVILRNLFSKQIPKLWNTLEEYHLHLVKLGNYYEYSSLVFCLSEHRMGIMFNLKFFNQECFFSSLTSLFLHLVFYYYLEKVISDITDNVLLICRFFAFYSLEQLSRLVHPTKYFSVNSVRCPWNLKESTNNPHFQSFTFIHSMNCDCSNLAAINDFFSGSRFWFNYVYNVSKVFNCFSL